MKKVVLMMIPALICGVMFTSCGSNKAEPKENEPEVFRYVHTELGGCNIKSTLKSDDWVRKDNEVIITVSDDFVHVFVGLNYPCKGTPFETKCELVDDVMCMYIIDTGGEYFRCMCYYTFDFIFQRQGAVNQEYKIILINRGENQVVISEGAITKNTLIKFDLYGKGGDKGDDKADNLLVGKWVTSD